MAAELDGFRDVERLVGGGARRSLLSAGGALVAVTLVDHAGSSRAAQQARLEELLRERRAAVLIGETAAGDRRVSTLFYGVGLPRGVDGPALERRCGAALRGIDFTWHLRALS